MTQHTRSATPALVSRLQCGGPKLACLFWDSLLQSHVSSSRSSSPRPPLTQVRLLLAPPGLAGFEDDSSFSAARLLFLFSASFAPPPPPAATATASIPPFSLSRSLSLSRLLFVRSDIFSEELLPEPGRDETFVRADIHRVTV